MQAQHSVQSCSHHLTFGHVFRPTYPQVPQFLVYKLTVRCVVTSTCHQTCVTEFRERGGAWSHTQTSNAVGLEPEVFKQYASLLPSVAVLVNSTFRPLYLRKSPWYTLNRKWTILDVAVIRTITSGIRTTVVQSVTHYFTELSYHIFDRSPCFKF